MKWTVSLPRTVAEDDKWSTEVEADSIEEAIEKAAYVFDNGKPHPGQVYIVSARVKVLPRTRLPLGSV